MVVCVLRFDLFWLYKTFLFVKDCDRMSWIIVTDLMNCHRFAYMNCHQIDWFSFISQPHRAAAWIQAAISFTLLWFQAFHALWRTWSYNHQSGASGFEMHTCFQNSKLFFRTGRNLVLPVHREDRQVCINPFAVLRIIGFRLRQLYQMPHKP